MLLALIGVTECSLGLLLGIVMQLGLSALFRVRVAHFKLPVLVFHFSVHPHVALFSFPRPAQRLGLGLVIGIH